MFCEFCSRGMFSTERGCAYIYISLNHCDRALIKPLLESSKKKKNLIDIVPLVDEYFTIKSINLCVKIDEWSAPSYPSIPSSQPRKKIHICPLISLRIKKKKKRKKRGKKGKKKEKEEKNKGKKKKTSVRLIFPPLESRNLFTNALRENHSVYRKIGKRKKGDASP